MKHLRLALEEQSDENKTVVMKGSLSEVYTQALTIAYAKDDPLTGVPGADPAPAMESQAMDVAYMKQLAAMIAPPQAVPTNGLTVYGVNQATLDEKEVVEVTQELADAATDDRTDDFILIIDGTQPGDGGSTGGEPVERFVQLGEGLESIATGFGIRVFHSLEEYARSR